MKCAIVTIPDLDNLGNRLQNYAVTYVLESLQVTCQSVRIINAKDKSVTKTVRRWIRQNWSKWAPTSFYNKMGHKARFTNFELFTNRNISEYFYYSENGMIPKSAGKQFEFYIVGSDQVWNPTFETIRQHLDNYLLTFAPPSKRISFAASFGVSELPEECKLYFAKELSKYKAISVREESGAKIVKKLIGREPEVLVDPTMMLDATEWRRVARKAKGRKDNQPYLLKYFLGDQSSERREYIQSIADKNGLAVYELLDTQYPELYVAGPDEFIDLVDNASLICTDSFHATVFSILFGKPFLVMERTQSRMVDMSSRITTLLSKLHLERKMPGKVIEENQIFECDYYETYKALKKEREKVYAFLKKAMSLE